MPLRNHQSKARRSLHGILEMPKNRARLRRAPVCAVCLIALMSLTGPAARAQIENAEAFFNSGAQFYISNNIPAALERTETGLKLYPDDAKLKKLEQLLKQQQQQQSQQQQQKNNQSQKNQNSRSQEQSQRQQQRQSDQEKQKQQQDQSARQKQQEQQQPNRQSAEKKEDDQRAPAPGQMSPQEAQRLLDAQKGNEQFLQLKPNAPPRSKQPAEDW